MAKKVIGISEFNNRKYADIDLSPEWRDHLGPDTTKKFSMCITGNSGNGKTTYMLMLVKELAKFGRVFINSAEQGFNRTLQTNIGIVGMDECRGKVMFGDNLTFDELMAKLTNKYFRVNYLVIDSVDYMKLTFEQYQQLGTAKKKGLSVIVVCWSKGNSETPQDSHAAKMEYASDVKVYVMDFVAYARSRFGGDKPFMIYKKGHLAAITRKGKKPVHIDSTGDLFPESKGGAA